MGYRLKLEINNIVRAIMILLCCSFTMLSTYIWGKYIMIVCLVAILLIDSMQNEKKYKFVITRYMLTIALFSIYAILSGLWAIEASAAITQGITLFELFLMIFVLQNYYRKINNSVEELLFIIKWSSFLIVIYSIFFYGIDTLKLIAMYGERMENSYANVNTIGMLAATGIIIEIGETVQEKRLKIATLLCIPSVVLLALTQSRKALIVMLVGGAVTYIFYNTDVNSINKKLSRLFISVILVVVLIYLMISLPIFDGIMLRMTRMFAEFTGIGTVDSSTLKRNFMTEIGWKQFLKTPVMGIGMGNSYILTEKYMGRRTYLHNNFIELLVNGGIVGFSIYYSMYIYLFITFWKQRRYRGKEYFLCITIMTVFFLIDYGRVSYYSKMNYIYLLLYFLEADRLRAKRTCN